MPPMPLLSAGCIIFVRMSENSTKINVGGFSESEFISWLYLERDREESIRKVHGWNTWVLTGALVSVLVFLYSRCKAAEGLIQLRDVVTLTALFTTLIMAYSWMRFLWRTERGRDIRKLRTLAEQAPMLNNIFMLIVSLVYYILFALLDINTVAWWGWLVCTGVYLYAVLNVATKKGRIVAASGISTNFILLRNQRTYEMILAGLNAGIGMCCCRTLKTVSLSYAVVEISAAIVLSAILIYKLLKLNPMHIIERYRPMDVIIDDILYNNDSRKKVFDEIRTRRIGFAPMSFIQRDLDSLPARRAEADAMIEKLRAAKTLIPDDRLITEEDRQAVIDTTTQALDLSKRITGFNGTVLQKISDILQQETPTLDDGFREFAKHHDAFTVDAKPLVAAVEDVISALNAHITKYFCRHSNSLCEQSDCPHRHSRPSLKFRLSRLIGTQGC